MAEIIVEEFDAAHKFVNEIVNFLFVEISHVVGCSNFVIFVSYDKKNFGGEIRNFLSKICDEAKKVVCIVTVGRSTLH